MPRSAGEYMGAVVGAHIAPILLIRAINIPTIADPTTTVSVYLTDADETISFFDELGNPEAYLPCGMSFDALSVEKSAEVKSLNLRLDNVSREFCTLVNQVNLSGVEVQFLRATRDELASPECAQVIIVGHVNSWTISESEIDIEVIVPLSLEQRVPRRMFWPLCGWEFGGEGCGYWSAPSTTNLAVQANAISGGDLTNYPKTQAFDGSTYPWGAYPGWKSSQTGTNVAPNAYIGQSGITEQVRRIRVYGAGVTTMPDSIKVQYSLDGSSWTDILTYDASEWSGMGYFDVMLPDYGVDVTHSIRLLANADLGSGYSWWILEMIINGVNSGPLPSGGCAHTLSACKAYGANEGFGGFPHLLKSRDPRTVWTKT